MTIDAGSAHRVPHRGPRRPLLRPVAGVVLAAALAAGCVPGQGTSGAGPGAAGDAVTADAATGILEEHGLDGLDAVEIIERLDAMPVDDRPADLFASVQPGALVVSDGAGAQVPVAMPDDEVYIAVAPYEQETHDCHFHSLTTCLGELGDTEVEVTLTGDDGTVLVDESRRTHDNGFLGLWVPRGFTGSVTITLAGRAGEAPVSTVSADDPTCITTLRLT